MDGRQIQVDCHLAPLQQIEKNPTFILEESRKHLIIHIVARGKGLAESEPEFV